MTDRLTADHIIASRREVWALREQVKELERKLAESHHVRDALAEESEAVRSWGEELRERVAELERERDETLQSYDGATTLLQEAGERVERAEAALRRIEAIPAGSDDEGIQARAIARAALGETA